MSQALNLARIRAAYKTSDYIPIRFRNSKTPPSALFPLFDREGPQKIADFCGIRGVR